jgi:hypothetical protein
LGSLYLVCGGTHFPPKDGSDDPEREAWLNSVCRDAVFCTI